MKKFLIVLFLASFLIVTPVYAQMNMMGGGQCTSSGCTTSQDQTTNTNINTALQDIYKTQNVSDQTKINCSKVTDDQFEKLGDASMGAGISEQQHTAMENMMGGEGSSTLKQAHITMGRSYLGCWSNYNGVPSMMSMMGGAGFNQGLNMMNNSFNPGVGMINNWSLATGRYSAVLLWFGFVTLVFLWGFLVLGSMVFFRWLGKNK